MQGAGTAAAFLHALVGTSIRFSLTFTMKETAKAEGSVPPWQNGERLPGWKGATVPAGKNRAELQREAACIRRGCSGMAPAGSRRSMNATAGVSDRQGESALIRPRLLLRYGDGVFLIVLFPKQLGDEHSLQQHAQGDHADVDAVQDLAPHGRSPLHAVHDGGVR